MRSIENKFFNYEIEQTEKVATRVRYISFVQAVRKTVSEKKNRNADQEGIAI